MSTNVGWATLSVIPSFKGFQSNLERGMAAPMVAASSRAGATSGTAAAKGFTGKFQTGIAGIGPKMVGALGIAALGKEVVGLQGDFESSMNVLAESADVPAAEMQRLAQFAKDMGAATVFSAGEAADAMVELAKAGLQPAQIEAGALSATMAVAATEGLGLAESATIMSNAMTTFRIEGERASEVADALAGGSKASTASVASLSEAMSQVGGSARDAHLSLQETVAVLAAFDQEGIKGSDAGTSLKTMLSRLVPQTAKARKEMERLGLAFTDANGQFLPMSEIAGQLQRAMGKLSDAERTSALNTIFGMDARRAAIALINQGESGILSFTEATSEMGAAQRLADARMKGTKGALEEMKGALENAGLAAGEVMAPGVVLAADSIAALTNGVVGLPTPVKAAAGAFVALKIASHFGATPEAGIGRLSSGMDTLRVRAMLAADAFRAARSGTLEFTGNTGRYVTPVGRLSASLEGLKAGAQGAGSALRRGLGGAMSLLGGPWGAAMIAATALVTHFWSENEKAKAFVDDLTGSLNEQTGALTDNTAEVIKNRLAEKGWLDYADKLGLSMDDVRLAAEGNAAALARVREEVERQAGSGLNPFNADAYTNDSEQFLGALEDSAAAIDEARAKQDQYNRFLGEGADAADSAARSTYNIAGATKNYESELLNAYDALNKLIEAEQERAENAVQNKRDQLALDSVLEDAREEARKGKRTLNENTEAGKANWDMLLDLAEQWNQSSDKVRGAQGAYREMRTEFMRVADDMGAVDGQAKKLADRFLTMPKAKIDTKSVDLAKQKIRELQALLDGLEQGRRINLGVPLAMGAPTARANGGPVNAGSPYWVGERGPELIVPQRAGNVLTAKESAAVSSGVNIHVDTVVAHDYHDFTRQMNERARRAASDGIRVP